MSLSKEIRAVVDRGYSMREIIEETTRMLDNAVILKLAGGYTAPSIAKDTRLGVDAKQVHYIKRRAWRDGIL